MRNLHRMLALWLRKSETARVLGEVGHQLYVEHSKLALIQLGHGVS
jgi:hypothetical protein